MKEILWWGLCPLACLYSCFFEHSQTKGIRKWEMALAPALYSTVGGKTVDFAWGSSGFDGLISPYFTLTNLRYICTALIWA